MTVIGVTGGLGTGKTFVSGIFASLGAKVIDADLIAHDLLRRGTQVYKQTIRSFGQNILDESGEIDRSKLGAVVFQSKRKLAALNALVHPSVKRQIAASLRAAKKEDVVILDAPLLIEAGLLGWVDMLVVVTATQARQVQRCKTRFKMSRAEALKRIRFQMSMAEKIKEADFVVNNNGTKGRTRRQVMQIWRKVWI